eukprot:TRINITY_DN14596_c0_g1_i1.p1 TRINITY_DN14596_c0_g1~~TRINITY_DN14596_c0_g1_i1.p1  ORF type:complete len:131 (-),score=14.36 TRINITY_DN14596_c0_g1_i1:84-476(-)
MHSCFVFKIRRARGHALFHPDPTFFSCLGCFFLGLGAATGDQFFWTLAPPTTSFIFSNPDFNQTINRMISSDHPLYFPFDLLMLDPTDVDSTLRIEEEVIAPLEAPKPIVASAPKRKNKVTKKRKRVGRA